MRTTTLHDGQGGSSWQGGDNLAPVDLSILFTKSCYNGKVLLQLHSPVYALMHVPCM